MIDNNFGKDAVRKARLIMALNYTIPAAIAVVLLLKLAGAF